MTAPSPARHEDQDASVPVIAPSRFDALLFDLDGVVTETARLHAEAWKEAFDAFLTERARKRGERLAPFDPITDYQRTVDGKPRENGIRDFLASRGITLPDGEPDDPPQTPTVHGIGNCKNAAYHRLLRQRGVEVHADTLDLIRRARQAGLICAIVSASRNTAAVLAAAELEELFDLRVDGRDLATESLRGKPAPDLFLLAARRAGVSPARAVVLEDALAGVRAGQAGNFGLVVGVARSNSPDALRAHGADLALSDLNDLTVETVEHPPEALPSAIDALPEITAFSRGRKLAVFLDYDGTLTPIVARPELAVLSEPMRSQLQRLAERCTVAVISGRDRKNVADRVGLPDLVYAGSHGFDIAGPTAGQITHAEGDAWRDALKQVGDELENALAAIDGALVERKTYGVAVHYRQVATSDVAEVGRIVEAAHERHPELAKTLGKKVYEFRPGIAWDKGKAVLWLFETLGFTHADTLPLYLGDDVTDEDAFTALAEVGVGILVGEGYGATRAHYRLDDVESVQSFLERLADLLDQRTGHE